MSELDVLLLAKQTYCETVKMTIEVGWRNMSRQTQIYNTTPQKMGDPRGGGVKPITAV